VSTGISVTTGIPGLELDWCATCRMQKSFIIGTDSKFNTRVCKSTLPRANQLRHLGVHKSVFGDDLMNNLMVMLLAGFGLGFGLHVSFHVFL